MIVCVLNVLFATLLHRKKWLAWFLCNFFFAWKSCQFHMRFMQATLACVYIAFHSIKCNIDGPYGTATREIFETEHAVLIGAGIGVTPMASILQSIMYRYKESKRVCPNCKFSFYGVIPESVMKLKKVDFS